MIAARYDMTAEELVGYEIPGKRVELVRGQLVVREPASLRHGELSLRVGVALANHLAREREEQRWALTRGRLATADPGFTLARSPDTVRAPDVAYLSRERYSGPMPEGYPELAPDLAVEVRSRGDRAGEVLAKVADWLSAGTTLVWVVDPAREVATVYRADGTVAVLGLDDALSGEALLPGFVLSLRELFLAE